MKNATENLPAVQTTDNLPTTTPALESLEFSEQDMHELLTAIQYAEKQDVSKMEAVRVDATYLEMEKGKSIVLMVAGYSWRKSEFGEGEVLSVNFYDPKEKNFRYAMQTALVGKIREGKLPKGQLCKITYLGKTKGKKYSYDDFKVEVLIAK
jgi:hypothetical protein